MFKECEHENIIDSVCNDCWMCIDVMCIDVKTVDPHFGINKISNSPNFCKDLKNIDIPDDVKNLVYKIEALSEKKISRLNSRKLKLFAYCYLAYLKLGYDFKPEELAQKLDIRKNVREAIKIAAGIGNVGLPMPEVKLMPECESFLSKITIVSPIAYFDEYISKLSIQNKKSEIETYFVNLLENNKLLYEENPNFMAIAIIKYYCDNNGITLSNFSKLSLKHTYFNKCYKKIEKLINNQ